MTSLLTILHKLARISYNFHTKLEIHKVVFLVLICIFLSKTLYSYAGNTEEFKNGIKFLIKNAEVSVFDPGMSSPNQIRAKRYQIYNGYNVFFNSFVHIYTLRFTITTKLGCWEQHLPICKRSSIYYIMMTNLKNLMDWKTHPPLVPSTNLQQPGYWGIHPLK